MDQMKNAFWVGFVDGVKDGPRLFFAPLLAVWRYAKRRLSRWAGG